MKPICAVKGTVCLAVGADCIALFALQAYLGPPSAAARYEILRSGVLELARAGLIAGTVVTLVACNKASTQDKGNACSI